MFFRYKSSILHFKRNLMLLKESKDDEGKPLLDETDMMIEIAGCYIMRNVSADYVYFSIFHIYISYT